MNNHRPTYPQLLQAPNIRPPTFAVLNPHAAGQASVRQVQPQYQSIVVPNRPVTSVSGASTPTASAVSHSTAIPSSLPHVTLPVSSINIPNSSPLDWRQTQPATNSPYVSPEVATLPASPTTAAPINYRQSPLHTISAQEAEIYKRNNVRLMQLEKEMNDQTTYGPACDEFLEWLQDYRAYNRSNEAALSNCAATVRKNYLMGRWSALRIFDTIYNFRHMLTPVCAENIEKWRKELVDLCLGNAGSGNVFHAAQLTAPQLQTPPLTATPASPVSRSFPSAQQQVHQMVSPPLYSPMFIPIASNPVHQPLQQQLSSVTGPAPRPSTPSAPPIQNQNPFKYMYRIDSAFEPFKLVHGKDVTITPFNVSRENFQALWKGPHVSYETSPLSYFVTSWRTDQNNSFKCEWPECVTLYLNNFLLKLERRQKIRPPNEPPNTYRIIGKDKPFELGQYIVSGKNELFIQQRGCACKYFFCVYIYRREDEETVLKKVMDQILDLERGRELINNLLSSAGDEDLVVTQPNIKISLKCPISLQRISQPVKGSNCKHPDCFDMKAFLAINEGKDHWQCPFCSKYVPPDKLYRDKFFEDLLERVDKHVVEIEFTDNCDNYKATKIETPDMNDDDKVQTEPTESSDQNVISLLSDDESEEPTETRKRKGEGQLQSTTKEKQARVEYPSEFAPMTSDELFNTLYNSTSQNSTL